MAPAPAEARRAVLLALCAIALAAGLPAPAAAATAQVSFAAPATLEGHAAASHLTWALLIFHGADPGTFSARLAPGGTATNHTTVRFAAPQAVVDQQPPASSSSPLPDPVDGTLVPAPMAWSSLYVEADAIGFAADARVLATPAESGGDPGAYLPPVQVADGTSRVAAHAVPSGPALAFAANGTDGAGGVPFRLEAEGVRVLEWHGADFTCSGSSGRACPPGAGTWGAMAPLGAGTVEARSYAEVQVPGGHLAGSGEAVAVAAGGPSLDAALAGAARLPDAHLSGRCGAAPCPDPAGRTLLAHGNLAFTHLERGAGGRLQSTLDGAFAAAYDEAPMAAFYLPLAAGAGLGLLAVVGLLFGRSLWALFARSERPPPLAHPRRQALHDLVRREPGLSFRGLQRSLGWPTGPLQAHLARLLEARLVVAQPHRNTVRYFENHGRYTATWREVAVLRDPGARRLHAWLQAHPGRTQNEAVQAAAGWGWSRARALRRLAGLEEAGLVARRRAGRTVHYAAHAARAGW